MTHTARPTSTLTAVVGRKLTVGYGDTTLTFFGRSELEAGDVLSSNCVSVFPTQAYFGGDRSVLRYIFNTRKRFDQA